ncbi:phage head closure protein [Globicatella sp. PHS-GS-PNBC-21-1553]|uniref:phage head closure protein n=1 Tax=Globicatella sp. PHS-GS-PNBC-21-1553 TaxID=2885764 RepID=UPI00298F07B9|nr:phage head closure protein [Globicatella sp. PHS-GS-PNBC-21-1553]WPC09777.1 phage head closure protein [Globicatella sp. PHS-GS-PNBC-21-1553]
MIQTFKAQAGTVTPDGFGGQITVWNDAIYNIKGYLDMLTGSDRNQSENAVTERSTHVLIIPEMRNDLNDKMRIVDSNGRAYLIEYVDDPVGVGHHLEVYLTYDKEV